jgi:NADH dehydrogenase (ubiquinone) 1 alpha subcomplex subunit 5
MLRRLAAVLPAPLRAAAAAAGEGGAACSSRRGLSAVNLNDPATLKQFVGLKDALGIEPEARSKLTGLLRELQAAVGALPATAGYRQAVEATVAYRLNVLDANPSDPAVEEVLDAHMEELILEAKEELSLLPIMADTKPWDVPADHAVPVFDYTSADAILNAPKK